jgi:hypothetical protein
MGRDEGGRKGKGLKKAESVNGEGSRKRKG